MKKEIIVSAVIAASVPAAVLAEDRINSVEVSASQGEFRNTTEVNYLEATVRQNFLDNKLYGVFSHTYVDGHPVENVEDNTSMVGVGYKIDNLYIEGVVNEDRYKASLMYEYRHDNNMVYSGGIWHGDMFDTNFSQTFANIGVGRMFDNVYIGGFYEVGNTTKDSVDDRYGFKVRYSW